MKKDDSPQFSRKDLDMADKVSKYNVSVITPHFF